MRDVIAKGLTLRQKSWCILALFFCCYTLFGAVVGAVFAAFLAMFVMGLLGLSYDLAHHFPLAMRGGAWFALGYAFLVVGSDLWKHGWDGFWVKLDDVVKDRW